MRLLLLLTAILISSNSVARASVNYEMKLYQLEGRSLDSAMKSRGEIKPLHNPSMVIEEGGTGSLSISNKNGEILLSLEITDLNDKEYEYDLQLFENGEKITNFGNKKKFKKGIELLVATDINKNKYLVEISTKKINSVSGEKSCGYISVRKAYYKRHYYPALIREINGDLVNIDRGEYKIPSGEHEILIYGQISEQLSKRDAKKQSKGALTRFKVLPNKIYYISAYYNKSEARKGGEKLWVPEVIKIADKMCE